MSRSSSARAAHLHAESAVLDDILCRLRVARQYVDELETQHHQLEARVQASRALYMQEFFHSCPEDLLRCIFDAAVSLPDEQWRIFGEGKFNLQRATLPFTLAAVNRRWRRIALGFPLLWTYIGIPTPPLKSVDLKRIHLLLERSAPCALDIVLLDDYPGIRSPATGDGLESCLSALSQHSIRWRKVDLRVADDRNIQFTDIFRGPLPSLTQLALVSAGDGIDPSLPDLRKVHLPFAPRLERLDLAFEAFGLSTLHHGGFPSLSQLVCWDLCPVHQIARLLSLTQKTLRYLELDSSSSHAPFPLAMTELRSLCLHDTAFFAEWPQPWMSMPKLSTISLSSYTISSALGPLLNHVAPTVTHLELFDCVDGTVLDTLKLLTNVVHLTFSRARLAQCQVEDAFFVDLADAMPPIWPKLVGVRIDVDAAVCPVNGDGILHFVGRRTVARTSQEAALRDVEVNYDGAPAWLIAEVARLLEAAL